MLSGLATFGPIEEAAMEQPESPLLEKVKNWVYKLNVTN